MSKPQVRAVRANNRILAALSAAEFGRISAGLELVPLVHTQNLYKANTPIKDVWFPESGMISLVQPLSDGSMIEVGMIGKEGMLGVPLALGANRWPVEAMVQMPGSALRMAAQDLLEAMAHSATLRKLLLRYTQALLIQTAQSAACNSRHNLNQRLARWLLTAHDRSDDDILRLSHEFIAMMLGIRRAGVTVALSEFKKAGILTNHHGRLTVLNRRALEEAACECYGAVKAESDRLMRS